MLGHGDTFDVSWSHDSSLLCACFSSGDLSVFQSAAWFEALLNPVKLLDVDARASPIINSTEDVKSLKIKSSAPTTNGVSTTVNTTNTNADIAGKRSLEVPVTSSPKRSMLSPGKSANKQNGKTVDDSASAPSAVADAAADVVAVKEEPTPTPEVSSPVANPEASSSSSMVVAAEDEPTLESSNTIVTADDDNESAKALNTSTIDTTTDQINESQVVSSDSTDKVHVNGDVEENGTLAMEVDEHTDN